MMGAATRITARMIHGAFDFFFWPVWLEADKAAAGGLVSSYRARRRRGGRSRVLRQVGPIAIALLIGHIWVVVPTSRRRRSGHGTRYFVRIEGTVRRIPCRPCWLRSCWRR
jgi:hypothetical protein